MDGGGGWSLRSVSSLVSRGDVDDVEELFVAKPARWRRQVGTAAAARNSFLEEDSSPEQEAPQRRSPQAVPSRSSAAARAHRTEAVIGALRLGLPAAARRPGANSFGSLVLLRLVFTALAAEVLAGRAEAAIRRSFREGQLRGLARRAAAWDTERSALLLRLVLRGWLSYATRQSHGAAGSPPHSPRDRLEAAVHCSASAATALLSRRRRRGLLEQCLLRWRTFVAEGLAMQVLVVRERLQLVDAECCVLRGEEKDSELRTHDARRRPRQPSPAVLLLRTSF